MVSPSPLCDWLPSCDLSPCDPAILLRPSKPAIPPLREHASPEAGAGLGGPASAVPVPASQQAWGEGGSVAVPGARAMSR